MKPPCTRRDGMTWTVADGDLLRKRRLAAGRSLRDAAGAVRASVPFVRDVEEGNRAPSDRFLRAYDEMVPLEPCPFCGSKRLETYSDPMSESAVSCLNCGAVGPRRCLDEGGTRRKEAEDWWNTRRTGGKPIYRTFR